MSSSKMMGKRARMDFIKLSFENEDHGQKLDCQAEKRKTGMANYRLLQREMLPPVGIGVNGCRAKCSSAMLLVDPPWSPPIFG